MLSRAEVESEITSGEIAIEYATGLATAGTSPTELSVDIASRDSEAYKLFDQAFFGNRLSVTLGPLVYSHRYRWRPGRRGYKNFPRVFDLRGSEGQIAIQPGESVAVNTAERVSLGSSIGALTFPRLSHATAGLVLSPSYIDPLWSGLLVLEITNLGARPFVLRMGEKIAAVHFYRVDRTDLTNLDREAFARKSHHYGLAWSSLLLSDRDPFPLRRRAEGDAPSFGFLDRIRSAWKQLLALGVSLAVVISAVVWGGALAGQIQNLTTVSDRVQAQSESLRDLEDRVDGVVDSLGYAGQARVTLAPNQSSVSVDIQSPTPEGVLPRIVVVADGTPTHIKVQAVISSGSTQSSDLTLTLTDMGDLTLERSYVIDFIVFP